MNQRSKEENNSRERGAIIEKTMKKKKNQIMVFHCGKEDQ